MQRWNSILGVKLSSKYGQADGPVEQLLALMYNSVIYNNLSVCTTQLNSAGFVHSDHFIVPPEDL